MATPSLKLATGDRLPFVGLGSWKLPKPRAAEVVVEAIRAGYRHFDCACDYGNEAEIGDGLSAAMQQGLCCREDLWITSKLWNTYHARPHVRPAVERSLRDLKLDYLDLYLMHFPIALKFVPFDVRYPPEWFHDPAAEQPRMEPATVPISETWGAMEELVAAGLVRNIGVCHFGVSLLRDLLSYAKIRPAVLQTELHPSLTQDKLLRFCQESQIAMIAFSPLGAESYVPIGMAQPAESVLNQLAVREAAQRHSKTPAQIVLRFGVQRGYAIVPKTQRSERLAENLALFEFELSPAEMQAIAALNRGRRFNDPGDFCEKAFHTYFPIYE
jgi:diketogulonate reductase-like aldo/keto reductase